MNTKIEICQRVCNLDSRFELKTRQTERQTDRQADRQNDQNKYIPPIYGCGGVKICMPMKLLKSVKVYNY